jgi:hypothetical protein
MRRALLLLVLPAAALLALPAAPALARTAPKVNLVSPMRVKVGGTLTIRGKGFSARKKRNTVIFRAPNGRSAFAKPIRAGRRKLILRVPSSLQAMLTKQSGGKPAPTRFQLRVLSGSFSKYTSKRVSPLVVSGGKAAAADCDADGAPNKSDSDDDNDLIPDGREASYKTDTCLKDTDGDGVEDGFEQESALDLNQRAVPYPGKRPFPNALDPGDSAKDYDGDALTNKEEFQAWAKAPASPEPSLLQGYYGGPPAFAGPYDGQPTFGGHTLPLNYSDGDQTSVLVRTGHPEYRWYLDITGDGIMEDDERDVDGDGLGNVNEIRLLMSPPHFTNVPEADSVCPYEYGPWLPRDFLQPDYLDWDSDGDGVWDGNDDQDSDDVSNVDEILPPYRSCGEPPGDVSPFPTANMRNPYNPCLPYGSRACSRYKPR